MKWPAGTNATVRKIENAGQKILVKEAMRGLMVIDNIMTVIRIGSWRKVETKSSLGVPPFVFVFLLRGFVDLHIGPSPWNLHSVQPLPRLIFLCFFFILSTSCRCLHEPSRYQQVRRCAAVAASNDNVDVDQRNDDGRPRCTIFTVVSASVRKPQGWHTERNILSSQIKIWCPRFRRGHRGLLSRH